MNFLQLGKWLDFQLVWCFASLVFFFCWPVTVHNSGIYIIVKACWFLFFHHRHSFLSCHIIYVWHFLLVTATLIYSAFLCTCIIYVIGLYILTVENFLLCHGVNLCRQWYSDGVVIFPNMLSRLKEVIESLYLLFFVLATVCIQVSISETSGALGIPQRAHFCSVMSISEYNCCSVLVVNRRLYQYSEKWFLLCDPDYCVIFDH